MLWDCLRAIASTSGIRVETGTGPLDEHNIFEEKGPVDILFVGSSLMVRGVDMNYIEQQLSQQLGRPARVRYLALKWQGLDMQYMLMKDFLEHRKAGMVIMDMPTNALIGDSPHIQAYRWMRWGEFPHPPPAFPSAAAWRSMERRSLERHGSSSTTSVPTVLFRTRSS